MHLSCWVPSNSIFRGSTLPSHKTLNELIQPDNTERTCQTVHRGQRQLDGPILATKDLHLKKHPSNRLEVA